MRSLANAPQFCDARITRRRPDILDPGEYAATGGRSAEEGQILAYGGARKMPKKKALSHKIPHRGDDEDFESIEEGTYCPCVWDSSSMAPSTSRGTHASERADKDKTRASKGPPR